MNTNFSIVDTQVTNGLYLEASAGTGKTWSIAAVVTREIALRRETTIDRVLITTFTRNAAGELRDRVRRRLIETAAALDSDDKSDDALVVHLRDADPTERAARSARLRRAAADFDGATISTIHSVCSRILVHAGLASEAAEEDEQRRVVRETVNDFVVAAATLGEVWDSDRLERTVAAALGAPDAELWIDPTLEGDDRVSAENAERVVADLVDTVRSKMLSTPTFDDLVRRAADVVNGTHHPEAARAIGERFSLVLIDEAQDTDPAQWDVFLGIVRASMGAASMLVVGDPKQSIYRFRGADVASYVAHRDPSLVVPLDVNHRSDGRLVDALNHLLSGTTYGPDIAYQPVKSRPDAPESAVAGVAALELVDMPGVTNGEKLRDAVVDRVLFLLSHVTIDDDEGVPRPLEPSDVCVLVGSNENGRLVERGLRRRGVPAVSGGTASVMAGEVAVDVAAVVSACDRVSDSGRVRRAAATMFFGTHLLDPELLDGGVLDEVSAALSRLGSILRRSGVESFAAELLAIARTRGALLGSDRAERRMTDARHVVELLNDRTRGRGVEPSEILDHLANLSALDAQSETVARRVESDAPSVTIMTIHGSKGLEFPVVVVADLWKKPTVRSEHDPLVATIVPGGGRKLDVAWAASRTRNATVADAVARAEMDELRRKFYVSVTRARHHVSVMVPSGDKASVFSGLVREHPLEGSPNGLRAVAPATASRFTPVRTAVHRTTSSFDADLTQTYQRTSFTGIVSRADDRRGGFVAPGSGHDEATSDTDSATSSVVPSHRPGTTMPLDRVPAGADVGTSIHSIFEALDTGSEFLEAEVARLVDIHASGPRLAAWRRELVDGLVASIRTPLGPFMGDRSLADIGSAGRLAELSFEMGLAHLDEGVRVSDLGRVLLDRLGPADPLRGYASRLAGPEFDVPLAGLINGSIDALLKVTVNGADRLFITDYKSNRLSAPGDEPAIEAYRPDRLVDAMAEHHYPLQALVYGVAIHRYLRWRAPHLDSDDVIGGVAYFFLRGMVDDPGLVVDGCPYGVFEWSAPRGLWSALSDAMSAVTA